MQQFRQVADIQTQAMLKLPVPDLRGGKPNVVSAPCSSELKQIVQLLVERAEALKTGRIDPRQDNMLLVTTDGRKAALDPDCTTRACPDTAQYLPYPSGGIGDPEAVGDRLPEQRGTLRGVPDWSGRSAWLVRREQLDVASNHGNATEVQRAGPGVASAVPALFAVCPPARQFWLPIPIPRRCDIPQTPFATRVAR
jgi:hypothetical protein